METWGSCTPFGSSDTANVSRKRWGWPPMDLPITLGVTILSTVLVVLANLGVDVWHALLDPRVRLE